MKQFVCPACGYVGKPKSMAKGSMVLELLLWLLGLILAIIGLPIVLLVALIYSIWRVTTKFKGCPMCKTAAMIPADSPMGRKLIGPQAHVKQPEE